MYVVFSRLVIKTYSMLETSVEMIRTRFKFMLNQVRDTFLRGLEYVLKNYLESKSFARLSQVTVFLSRDLTIISYRSLELSVANASCWVTFEHFY